MSNEPTPNEQGGVGGAGGSAPDLPAAAIAPEGWPIVAGFVIGSAVLTFLGAWLLGPVVGSIVGFITVALTVWCVWFFRDPRRRIPVSPPGKVNVISPADGVVCMVQAAIPPEELGVGEEDRRGLTRVSVFMNVFNVHVNRAPVAGVVEKTAYHPGKFFNASLDKASEHNERMSLLLRMPDGRAVICVQIAGLIARRIVCRVKDGARLGAAERFGVIRFGSRVDVYLPRGVEARVKVGDKSVAGETVLAVMDGGRADMFINYPSRKQTVPLRIIVPNLFTTVAMCCGLASIHYSLKGDWDRAMFAVVLSAIFDSLDGRAARLLKVTSPFGEVLDSLSDFLSFGVAPAILLYEWMFRRNEIFGSDVYGLLAVTTFVVCSAMRLARFTAGARPTAPGAPAAPAPEVDAQRMAVVKAKFFTGLATPSAAGAVMVPVMLSYSKLLGPYVRPKLGMPLAGAGDEAATKLDSAVTAPHEWAAAAVLIYTLVIAFWMISRLPMFSFKKMRISRRAVVPLLVCVGLVVVLAVKDLWLLLPGITLVYLLSAPISWLSHARLVRGQAARP